MDRAITVSVIIPIYNIEPELLRRCVESVAAQTYDPVEIILVDDGSDKPTAEFTDELGSRYGATVIHKPNGGSSSARNAGLKAANGEYIGFVDSDDYVDPEFVELMMDAIERLGLPMAQISRDEIAPDGSRLPDVCIPPKEECIITGKEQMRELLLHRGDCSFCTRLTARRMFDGRSFPEGKLNEDFRLLIQMLPDIDRYVIIPRQAYHVYYRVGSNSRSADKEVFRQVYADIVDNADYAKELTARFYPELSEEAERFALYQRLEYMLHVPIGMMNNNDQYYPQVLRYLRHNIAGTFTNGYLTKKNKLYLILLTIAPRLVRRIHVILRK